MENIINLNLEKTISKLAGNQFGRSIFEEQAKDKFDFLEKVLIVFPPHIDNIATSFIHGFFEDMVKEIGIDGIEKNVTIEAKGVENNENLDVLSAKDFVMRKLRLF